MLYCIEYQLLNGKTKRTEPDADFLKVLRKQGEMLKANAKKEKYKKIEIIKIDE